MKVGRGRHSEHPIRGWSAPVSGQQEDKLRYDARHIREGKLEKLDKYAR